MFTAGQLQTFIAVAECGSFTAAAVKRGVTQSTISRRIKDLESRMDVDLFIRESMNIGLTEAGKVFLPHAKLILKMNDEAIKAVQRLRSHAKR